MGQPAAQETPSEQARYGLLCTCNKTATQPSCHPAPPTQTPRRVRVLGDDVRILRCYPGQWQVHYVPPPPQAPGTRSEPPVLLSCEDGKPTFQRLIELLKAVRGSR